MDIKDAYLLASSDAKETDKQRFSFFNFFIVLAGLLTNAIASCINNKIYIFAIIAASTLILISILFVLLEKRNAYNFKRINDLLVEYEQILMKENSDFTFL